MLSLYSYWLNFFHQGHNDKLSIFSEPLSCETVDPIPSIRILIVRKFLEVLLFLISSIFSVILLRDYSFDFFHEGLNWMFYTWRRWLHWKITEFSVEIKILIVWNFQKCYFLIISSLLHLAFSCIYRFSFSHQGHNRKHSTRGELADWKVVYSARRIKILIVRIINKLLLTLIYLDNQTQLLCDFGPDFFQQEVNRTFWVCERVFE